MNIPSVRIFLFRLSRCFDGGRGGKGGGVLLGDVPTVFAFELPFVVVSVPLFSDPELPPDVEVFGEFEPTDPAVELDADSKYAYTGSRSIWSYVGDADRCCRRH